MPETPTHLAIDLGAGSGRVVAGVFGDDGLTLEVLHRFDNTPRAVGGHERWDAGALFAGILDGLRRAPKDALSVGVDTWGVDYALLDHAGNLLDDPVCYRDPRTDGAVDAVLATVPRAELFARTGVQIQPFNTLYQMWAQVRAGEWPEHAATLLMMPDLFHWMLCGAVTGEVTNASTTQLLGAATREWDVALAERLGLPHAVLPPLAAPGTRLGTVRPELGLPELDVIAPATHDTASAVAGAPLEPGQAFLSSGTWSLLGVERDAPLLTGEVARANLTNEAGAEGTTRLLRNIMGLWILESMREQWGLGWDELLPAVEAAPPRAGAVDPNDARFFHPADMTAAVRGFLEQTGQEAPREPGSLARIALESLAASYAAALDEVELATGDRVGVLRIIGGGAQNAFLNQATADATMHPVLAGPVEATALGNLVVQAIATGRFAGVAAARSYLRAHVAAERYEPADAADWERFRRRFEEIRTT